MHALTSRKKLAIDLDSVLADTMVIWAEEYNKRNNSNITKDNIISWDISKILDISITEVSDIFSYIWDKRWLDIPSTESSIGNIVTSLHDKGFRISILTKRYRSSVTNVIKWLDFHKIHCDDLLFVYDDTPKTDYPFDILVDDAPINFSHLVHPRVGVLFNQPWNKNFSWPVRIDTLSEVLDII
jgi:5'(3')-deoxyribonucleotidase